MTSWTFVVCRNYRKNLNFTVSNILVLTFMICKIGGPGCRGKGFGASVLT